MRGTYRVADPQGDAQCLLKEGLCVWLDTDEFSRNDPANRSIPQYPALLLYDSEPYESDGEGLICRYRRIK